MSKDEIEEGLDIMHNQIRWYVEKEREFTVPDEERDVFLIYALLDISYDDFYASEILYKKNYFPQSVFLLQQSAEKLGKSLLVLMGFCKDEEELKTNVGHRFTIFLLKILRRLIPELHKYIDLKDYYELLPAIDRLISNYNNKVKDNFELRIKIDDFRDILKFFPKLFKMMKKGFRKAKKEGVIEEAREIFTSNIDKMLDGFKPYLETELTKEQEKEAKDELEEFLENQNLEVFAIIQFNIILLFIYVSIICYNLEGHVNISRYYVLESLNYEKDSNIVKISPNIAKTMKLMLKIYEETLDMCIIEPAKGNSID